MSSQPPFARMRDIHRQAAVQGMARESARLAAEARAAIEPAPETPIEVAPAPVADAVVEAAPEVAEQAVEPVAVQPEPVAAPQAWTSDMSRADLLAVAVALGVSAPKNGSKADIIKVLEASIQGV